MQSEEVKRFRELFPKRLEIALEIAHTNQKELASKIGCTEASMSRYANGQRIPKATTVTAIHKALGCDLKWLMCIY